MSCQDGCGCQECTAQHEYRESMRAEERWHAKQKEKRYSMEVNGEPMTLTGSELRSVGIDPNQFTPLEWLLPESLYEDLGVPANLLGLDTQEPQCECGAEAAHGLITNHSSYCPKAS